MIFLGYRNLKKKKFPTSTKLDGKIDRKTKTWETRY